MRLLSPVSRDASSGAVSLESMARPYRYSARGSTRRRAGSRRPRIAPLPPATGLGHSELEATHHRLRDEAMALERPRQPEVQPGLKIRCYDPTEPQLYSDLTGTDREEPAAQPQQQSKDRSTQMRARES